jgi:hypothetical protein
MSKSKTKFTVKDAEIIESGLRELSTREKLDPNVAWDILTNVQHSEPETKKLNEIRKQLFEKYSSTKDGQTGIATNDFAAYEAELDLVLNKELDIDFKTIPFDALKDKDGKVHTDLLLKLSKIVVK